MESDMAEQRISRRKFLQKTSAGAAAGALGAGVVLPEIAGSAFARPAIDYSAVPAVDRKQFFAAFGDTLIPTATGYPGYKRLEAHGITDEVMKSLTGIAADDLNVFNASAREFFDKPFVELGEVDRTTFLERVVATFPADTFAAPPAMRDAQGARLPQEQLERIQRVFRLTRTVMFNVFYQNFPENRIQRDAQKAPVLPAGDQHQILNPNTAALITGWDVANFPGPLSWDEEEKRRAYWKKIHWHED